MSIWLLRDLIVLVTDLFGRERELLPHAWKDDPVEILCLRKCSRIATRGRHLLDQIIALFMSYDYAVEETTHDCGELGGLAQSRKRFLLVARDTTKVPPFFTSLKSVRLQKSAIPRP